MTALHQASERPHDAPDVQHAFRFGWTIVEFRGRYRLGGRHVALPQEPISRATEHALPLARERSESEQKQETLGVLADLALKLDLDQPVSKLDLTTEFARCTPDQRAVECARDCGNRLEQELKSQPKSDPTETEGWSELIQLLYRWDASIQNTFAARPSQAAAYQLGRGLAETYWALQPDVSDGSDPRGWTFLFGKDRRTFLKRQLSRLSGYTAALVPVAINQSLDDWCEVANDPKWRSDPLALADLHQQTLVWRDLIQGEREPADLFGERTVRVPMRILSGSDQDLLLAHAVGDSRD